jgi:hypothetical protein
MRSCTFASPRIPAIHEGFGTGRSAGISCAKWRGVIASGRSHRRKNEAGDLRELQRAPLPNLR